MALMLCVSALYIGAYAADDSCGFAVATDLHYVHPLANVEDYVESEEFNTNKNGHSYQHESGFIIDEFLRQCAENDNCDFVLIPGDLATYGREYVEDHYTLAAKFRAFEQSTGKQVYVINGNHDNGKESLTNSAKFREIYNEFGYDKAFAVDESCCSYAVNLNDKYGLIALDSCDEQYRLASGVDFERVSWVREQAKAITESGRQPILMMHHNLLEHTPFELITQDKYIVSMPRTYASIFADCGIKLVFTGHTHTADAVSFTSPCGNTIYDFCSAALSEYPMQYRQFTLTDDEINYEMKTVQKIDTDALTSIVSGYSEESIKAMSTDFPKYAGEKQKAMIIGTVNDMISAEGLGVESDSIFYDTVNEACEAVKALFDMPLYGEDSVQQLAEGYGITLPESDYDNVWNMIGDASLNYAAGKKVYGSDSTEMEILFDCAKVALKDSAIGNADGFISSAVDVIMKNVVSEDVANLVESVTESTEKLAVATVSAVVDAFCADTDGVDNVSGTLPGYYAQPNDANIFDMLISLLTKLVSIMTTVIDSMVR